LREKRLDKSLFDCVRVILRNNTINMKNTVFIFFLMLWAGILQAQNINYSIPDRDDTKDMNFEIIGKVSGNYSIYKNNRNSHDICIYNNEMELKNRIRMEFLPERITNLDFVAYGDFYYMIYQYQKKNILHCEMIKINGEGKLMTEAVELDTTQISGSSENKIYRVINSDDKKKILVFKVKRQHEKGYQITSLLYDNQMSLIKRSVFTLQVNNKDGLFTDFLLDNDGDFVVGLCSRSGNREYINKFELLFKKAEEDRPILIPTNLDDKTLDEVKIKFDNYNKRIITTSLYYKLKKSNIDGIYSMIWDKKNQTILKETSFQFNDSIRLDAKGESGSLKAAFNDHFIKQVIPLQDGGYAVTTELYYSSSKSNTWNRYDYLYGNNMFSPYSYGYYSPFNRFNYMGYYDPFNRFNMGNQVRYTCGNIMVFFFEADGSLRWNNAIRKSQFDDNTESYLSYQLFNTGTDLRFLFNQKEKREFLLNSVSIDSDGKIKRQPTLKNLNRDYEFMPKHGKQVGLRQVILPCMYKNYICFAKLEF